MLSFFKKSVPEYIFLTMISFGLSLNVFSSFYITSSIASNYFVLVAMVLLINLYLFCIQQSNKSIIAGYVCLVIVLLIFVRMFYSRPFSKVVLIVSICAVICKVLSKYRVTFWALILSSILSTAAFRFLMYPVNNFGFVIMLVGLISEAIVVFTQRSKEKTFGNIGNIHLITQCISISFLSILFSLCIFSLLIAPLNLPTREIKLLTKMMSFDVLERVGVAASVEMPSDKMIDTTVDSNKKDKSNDDMPDKKNQNNNQADKQEEKELFAGKNHSNSLKANAISYNEKSFRYVMVLFIMLVLIAPIVIKFLVYCFRNKHIQKLDANDSAVYIYSYLLKVFKKLGIKREKSMTLNEFVANNDIHLKKYDSVNNVKFEELTRIYELIIYGLNDASENQLEKFKDYYYSLYKSIRKNNNFFKCILLYFVL